MAMSASRPLVSVVIPTHNRAYCIAQSIDSVLAQTYPEVEVVVVDDGSTDDTPALMADRYGADRRVRYERLPKGDANVARNHGLACARGAYIALLDSDDAFLPWKLELQIACLEAVPEAGMIWTDMDAVDESGELRPRYLRTMYSNYRRFSTEQIFKASRPLNAVAPQLGAEVGTARLYWGDIFGPMVMGNLVQTSTAVLRRARLTEVGGFDARLVRAGVDFDFHLRTCRVGAVAYADVATIRYRVGMADQMTRKSRQAKMAENFLRTITPVISRDRERIDLPQAIIDDTLAEAEAFLGSALADDDDHDAARGHLLRSLRLRPHQPAALKMLLLSMLPVPVKRRLRQAYRSLRDRAS
jgi:glycosyltransferase involved in cell wall biosynthesis